MADGPQWTVAIPTYNGSVHLVEALRSILAQEDVPFELVVCDDRSDDVTLEVARAEAGDRARIEVNSERLGLAGNWNRCVALSQTPWVTVFHQDDVMRPGHLAAQVRATTSHTTLGLVCGAASVIDTHGLSVPPSIVEQGDLGPVNRVFGPGEFVAELTVSNPVRCSATSIRVEAHGGLGGFDASYGYVVDWDFWLRLARTWAVAWLAAPTVAVRWHPASETHRFKTGMQDLEEVERLIRELHARDAEQLDEPRKLRNEAERRLARAYLNRAHEALYATRPELARRALSRTLALWPGILRQILVDPRLAAHVAALMVAPGPTARWLSSRKGPPETVSNPPLPSSSPSESERSGS